MKTTKYNSKNQVYKCLLLDWRQSTVVGYNCHRLVPQIFGTHAMSFGGVGNGTVVYTWIANYITLYSALTNNDSSHAVS